MSGTGYKVRGPSSTMPGAFDVETEDGRVIPVAPGGLPEYQATPKIEASQGEPTAEVGLAAMGMTTVSDVPKNYAGVPAKAEVPRIQMPPAMAAARKEAAKPKKVDPASLVARGAGGGEAPPAETRPALPGGASTDPRDAVGAVLAENKAIEDGFGKAVWTGTPTTRTESLSYEGRDLSPDAEARVAKLGAFADEKTAEADAARARVADTEAKALAAKATALEEQQKIIAEEGMRSAERQAKLRSEADAVRAQALADDGSADELKDRYGTQDTLRRVIGGIGMFFAGQTGNVQGTIGFINASIEDAWRRDMESLKRADGKGDKKRSYAAELLRDMGDEGAAFQRFRTEALAKYSADGERLALRAGSQNALDKNAELQAAVEAERANAESAAIIGNAPIRKVDEKSTVRTGGMRGGATKEEKARVRQFTDEGRKEGVSERSDLRKSALDAERKGEGENSKLDAAQRRLTEVTAAGEGLKRIAERSKSEGGVVFDASDASLDAMKVAAADHFKQLGLDEQAKAVAGAESQAAMDAIVANGIAEAKRKQAEEMANLPAGRRVVSREQQQMVAEGAAGDLSKFGNNP